MKVLKNKNIVIASLQSWYSPMLSKHYLTLELLKLGNKISFLTLHRIGKQYFLNKKKQRSFKCHSIKPEGLELPVFKVMPGFLRSQILLRLAINQAFHILGTDYSPDILILFDPQFHLLHDLYPEALKIYYCVDYVSINSIMRETENKVLSGSDMVFAASKQLYDDLQPKHNNVYYVPHGVSLLDDYEDSQLENRIESWFKDKEEQSVFGFLGHINSSIDFELVEYIAVKNPQSLIALIGPVAPGLKNRLATFPQNVFYPGPIPSNGVRYCLSNFDVGIVPYVQTKFNLRRNPIKIMQYLASGVPVVSTNIGLDYLGNEFVKQCCDYEDFNRSLLLAALNKTIDLLERMRTFTKENSWLRRIQLIDDLIVNFKS